jgi:DNA-binding beta-propeller fold protein YncE
MTSESSKAPVIVGTGDLKFEAYDHWEKLPEGWDFREAVGVTCDSRDRVYVFSRSEHPVTVFDREGNFLSSWGEGDLFVRPHSIYCSPDDAIWIADDCGHVVHKFTQDGQLLMTLGERGKPSDTGIENNDFRTIKQAAGPFNLPTHPHVTPDGDIWISDGYGNASVHRFSPDGKLLLTFGEPGTGEGQFSVPHGVMLSRDGIIYICDREYSRIQRFDQEGNFIDFFGEVARPCLTVEDKNGLIYVAEVGFRAGMYHGMPIPENASGSRVSVFTPEGELVSRWGGDDPEATGSFWCAHGIALDSHGDLYIAEVRPGAFEEIKPQGEEAPSGVSVLQKFVRI